MITVLTASSMHVTCMLYPCRCRTHHMTQSCTDKSWNFERVIQLYDLKNRMRSVITWTSRVPACTFNVKKLPLFEVWLTVIFKNDFYKRMLLSIIFHFSWFLFVYSHCFPTQTRRPEKSSLTYWWAFKNSVLCMLKISNSTLLSWLLVPIQSQMRLREFYIVTSAHALCHGTYTSSLYRPMLRRLS